MKKLSRINFNHATKEIIITKAFETEANVIGSAAYDELVRIPLEEVAGKLKMVDPDSSIVKEAKALGISFGD